MCVSKEKSQLHLLEVNPKLWCQWLLEQFIVIKGIWCVRNSCCICLLQSLSPTWLRLGLGSGVVTIKNAYNGTIDYCMFLWWGQCYFMGAAGRKELGDEGSSLNTYRNQEEEWSVHGKPVTTLLEKWHSKNVAAGTKYKLGPTWSSLHMMLHWRAQARNQITENQLSLSFCKDPESRFNL